MAIDEAINEASEVDYFAELSADPEFGKLEAAEKLDYARWWAGQRGVDAEAVEDSVAENAAAPLSIYEQLEKHDSEFSGLSPSDQLGYARWLVEQKQLPAEESSQLLAEVQKGVLAGQAGLSAARPTGLEAAVGRTVTDVAGGVSWYKKAFSEKAKRFASQPIEATATELGWDAADLTAYVAGLVPQAAITLGELPLLGGQLLGNEWAGEHLAKLEELKKSYDALQTPGSGYGVDIALAAVTAGGTEVAIETYRGLRAGALAEQLATAGAFSKTVAAAKAATVGELVFATPATQVVLNGINESGYDENTKSILRLVAPFVVGVTSAATVEAKTLKLLDPEAVAAAKAGYAAGKSAEEVAADISRVVKRPSLFDKVAEEASGNVPASGLGAEAAARAEAPAALEILPQEAVRVVEEELPPSAIKVLGKRGEELPFAEPVEPGFEVVQPRSKNLRPVEEDWVGAVAAEAAPAAAPAPKAPVVPEVEAPRTARLTPGSVEENLQRGWLRFADELPAVESETARLLAEAEAPLARAKARKAARLEKAELARTRAERARPLLRDLAERRAMKTTTNLPEQLTDLASYDNVLGFAQPAVAAAQRVRVARISGAVDFAEFQKAHGVLFEKLAKYEGTEKLLQKLRLPETATELTSLHTDRLLALSYHLPGTNNWTVEAFDDMLEAARHAEALHAKVTRVRSPLVSSKRQLAEQAETWLGKAKAPDANFVRRVLSFVKSDDKLFRLLPSRDLAGRGSYEFTQNLLKLKDSRALPHEIGHWGFFNALDGAERLQYLTMLRDRLKTGWRPGEKLVRGEVTYPDGRGIYRSNSGLNPNEYFAEQFAQFFYTRRTDNALMNELCDTAAGWSERLLRGMKNENLLDKDLEPFFARFAEVSKLERLHHPELGDLLETTEVLTDAIVRTRALAKQLGGAATLSEEGFATVVKEFGGSLQEAISNGSLKLDDARRFFKLGKKRFRELLFDPRQSEVLRTMSDLGLTAQENPALVRQARELLANDVGAVNPLLLRQVALHSVPLVAGFENRDGELHWNSGKALKVGAVWWGLALSGKAWRSTKLPGQLLARRAAFNERFFNFMTAPAESKLGRGRQFLGDLATYFRRTEGVDPEIWGLGRQFLNRWRQIDRELSQFSETLRTNFSAEEREMISNVIEQEGDFAKASEAVKAQAEETQLFLRGVREKLVASGVDPKVVSRYGDQWLHRVYLPKLLESPRLVLRQKRLRALSQSYLRPRGETVQLTQARFGLDSAGFAQAEKGFSFVDRLGRKRWALESQSERLAELRAKYGEGVEWTVKKDSRGRITANRAYSRAERTAMGESRDAALRLADFFRESSHDLALGEMFQQVDLAHTLEPPSGLTGFELEAWARENDVSQMPSTFTTRGLARYGVLNGKWVKSDVKKVLERLTSTRFENELLESVSYAYRRLFSFWKAGVTAFNPGSHMTNFITNNVMLEVSGYPLDLVHLDGVRAMAGGEASQIYREALEAGWAPHSLAQTEFNVDLFTRELTNTELPTMLKAFHKAVGFSKKAVKAPLKLYSLHDDVVKLGIFAQERAAGRSVKEALEAAERIIPDYSDLPRGVQFLRDTAIMPFVTWTYKIIPTVARTLVTHPEKYALLLLAAKAVDDYSYEKQFGEKAEAQRALERELSTRDKEDHDLFGIGPNGRVRLASDGQIARFVDVRKYVPGADLFENTTDQFPFGMNPLATTLYGMASGKAPFKNRKFRPFDDPKTQAEEEANFEADLQFLANTWLPKIPGMPLIWSTEKLGNALVASGTINEQSTLWDYAQERGWTGKDYFGNDVSIGDTLLQLGGIPIERVDLAGAAQVRRAQAAKRLREAPRILTKEALSSKSTPARREKAREQYEQQVGQASEEIRRLNKLLREAR